MRQLNIPAIIWVHTVYQLRNLKTSCLFRWTVNLITQVLVNLLDNALKHTDPESSIIVRVKARKNKAVFDVIDDGPGIPKRSEGKHI